jgi:putative ABC transport system permease protein
VGLVVNLTDGTDVRQAAFDIVQAAGGRVSTEDREAEFDRDLTEIRSQLRSVMLPLSATLLLTATVNLLATLLFAVREQSRDLAILKTIGFTPRQLVVSVVAGAVCFMVIALAVGGPAGYFAMSQLAEYFAREEGWPAGVAAVPELPWLIAVIPAALLVAAIGSALPAREVARTSASETLRIE